MEFTVLKLQAVVKSFLLCGSSKGTELRRWKMGLDGTRKQGEERRD